MRDIQQTSNSGSPDLSLSEILANAELGAEIEKWSPAILISSGEILFRQGDAPGYAFFVKSGEIALTMDVSVMRSGAFGRLKAPLLVCLRSLEVNPIR